MTIVIGVFLDVLNGNEFFNFSSQAVLDYLNIYKGRAFFAYKHSRCDYRDRRRCRDSVHSRIFGTEKEPRKEVSENSENTNIEKPKI